MFTYIIIKVRLGIKQFKHQKNESTDFFSAVKTACSEILPDKLITPFATEISVFYYGFINWRRRKLKPNEFSYHKESSTQIILITFIFLIAIETFALHLALVNWQPIFAWVLTGLSTYTGLQVFGIRNLLVSARL